LCEEKESSRVINVPVCVLCVCVCVGVGVGVGVCNLGHRLIYVGKCGLPLKPVLTLKCDVRYEWIKCEI